MNVPHSVTLASHRSTRGAFAWIPIAVVAALAAIVFWGWQRGRGTEPEAEKTLVQRYMEDPRIANLLLDCHIGLPYSQDTSDLMDVMVGKLADGQLDVLHRFKAVLAEAGEEAVPALRRLFDEVYTKQFGSPVAQNVLATCALMSTGAGLEIARDGFQHPREDVRLAALDVLIQHGEPSDYDDIEGWLPMVAHTPIVIDYLKALAKADFERFAETAIGWMEKEEFRGMEYTLAPLLTKVTDPDLALRMRDLALGELVPQPARAAMLVPSAREGDQAAIGELTNRLSSDITQRVVLALDAIGKAGLHEMAQAVLGGDERPSLRQRAAAIMAEGEPTEESFVWLNEGLSDSAAIVRSTCLKGLLVRNDPAAVSRVLNNLTKTNHERDEAMNIIAAHWDADPEMPRKAYDILLREYEAQSTQQGYLSIYKVMARIPLPEATQFLFEQLDDLPEEVSGLSSHRWVTGHAFNGGPTAMPILYEQLSLEKDPIRRLNLIGMIWQDKSEASEQVLFEVLGNPANDPFERLWAAERLTRIARPEVLAPIVKQFYFESTHRHIRPALQCLLWRWYGLPNA